MKKTNSVFIRLLSFLLIFAFILPFPVFAATPNIAVPTASYYLDAYGSYICPLAQYDIQIWWNIIGTGTMADIGALSIYLYESTDTETWTWIKTYQHTTYTQMLDHNTAHSMDYVFYDGDHECYYKAYVAIYAGNGTTGDTRYFWTPVVKGTP